MPFTPEIIPGGRTTEDTERDKKLAVAAEFLKIKEELFKDAGIDLTDFTVRKKATDLFITFHFQSLSFATALAGTDPVSINILHVLRSILGGPDANASALEANQAA